MNIALFIKLATALVVLLYVIAVNNYRPAQTKKSLKSPLKNDFSAFGNNKPQLTTQQVLKLLGHEYTTKPDATPNPNLPTSTEVDPTW